FKEIAPELPVVILTGYGDVPSAVEAMRLGAYDFLTKPVEPAKVLVVVRRALKHRALGTELKELRRLGQRDALRWLMGRGQEIQQVIQQRRQSFAARSRNARCRSSGPRARSRSMCGSLRRPTSPWTVRFERADSARISITV